MSNDLKPSHRRPLIIATVLIAAIIAGVVAWYRSAPYGNHLVAQRLLDAMIAEGEIELLTLYPIKGDPDFIDMGYGKTDANGWVILDSRLISDKQVVSSLLIDIIGNKPDDAAACMGPRHSVRMVDNPEHYIAICFQCSNFEYSYG
jgi:hypothetical protein